MYLAGHLLSSIALAKIIHKPLGVKFFNLAIAAMAVNLVDADHLIYYYRDSGIGNSFQLHPLHQFWAFIGLAGCLISLILKPYQNLIAGALIALGLHYGLDWASNLFAYKLDYVILFEAVCIGLLAALFWKDSNRLKYFLFCVGLWVICDATLGFETMFLQWQPHETRGIYLTSAILNILAIIAFWIIAPPESKQLTPLPQTKTKKTRS